ncbi:alpha/beta fold hydrolase [Acidocella sp.]|uniref:alpha/beta fold hydrolase n=1 Tax=Acidocella sp. TaxID=50710 RepID=UPI002633FEA8|nr:alpha/beta hydrolase [Acidocella sp.]
MRPVYVLVHGWGFGAAFWAPMAARLAPEDVLCWDLGFFGAPSQPPIPPGRFVVAVGHSLGALWLMHERPFAWDRLVAINGFGCFAARPGFEAGVAPRVLARMRARLATHPREVLAGFYGQIGYGGEGAAAPDVARLAWGLAALAGWDARPRQADLALCGAADPLLTRAMSEACFARITWHEGGHLLPLEDPDWCAANLKALAP